MKSFMLLTSIIFLSATSIAETTFNWGISTRLTYFRKISEEFKETIEKKSQNRIKINIDFYNDVKNEKGTEEYFRSGKYQIHQMLAGNFIHYAPELKVWNIPFLFRTDKQVEKYLRSKNAQTILKKIDTPKLFAIDYSLSGGFIYLHASEELHSFDPIVGKTFSIMYDFGFVKDFLAPRGINTEIRNSNQQFAAYGEILGADLGEILGLDYIDKVHTSVSNHRIIARIVCLDKKTLEKLSASDKELFLTEFKKFMLKERELSYEGRKISLALYKNRGHYLYEWTEKEFLAEREKFKDGWGLYRREFGKEIDYIESLK